ncbi:epoxide hydrolase [Myxococcus sp. MISCRS1]|uniref:epoxide hydrolase family protein n=1 Tax=Myxococcus sp. MISCRS1 TaxID=2996786 RepID=UPI00226FA21D|nr:epoxide hydrolase family protein [Myxococcus sp. MISCRS1]MCY0997370.1 epoxide hydrolase [Myxococcus sp. MISCRS1]
MHAPQRRTPRPFTLSISDAELDDLRARLKATRFPATVEGVGWDDGTDAELLRRFVTHWAERFDWRAAEQRLNAVPQFIEEVDGERVHFVHAPGQGGTRVPIVLANGWPSNLVEFLPLIPLLTAERNGVSFDVIIPSLQGFGFSGRPTKRGMNMSRMGHLWAELMTRVGYEKFLVACSDLGSGVCFSLVRNHPGRLLGAHYLNVFSGYPRPQAPTPEEVDYFRRVDLWTATQSAYVMIHGTKPQTLAVGLNDSPAGLASWILEKFHGCSHLRDGRLESVYSLDDLCTLLSVYWFTQTIGSSVRLYKEAFADQELLAPMPRHDVKQGVLVPADVDNPAPRAWGERHLQNLVHWTEARLAGHFPALEAPEHYAADLRAFHGTIR